MALRKLDATTRKLLSPESVWKSTRPNKYRDAIIKMSDLLESENQDIQLRAAEKIIAHTKGTPKQSVDVTSKDKQINSPIFLTSDPELQDVIKKLSSGE